MKKLESIVWGLIFIVLGLIVGLNTLGIASINVFFDGWWTLFLIIPGIMGLFKDKDKTGNIILLVVGILLLLGSQDIINFETIMKLVFPAILVIIGLSCLIKGLAGSDFQEKVKEIKSSDKDTLKCDAVFTGQKVVVENPILGADVNAIFGGLELDLRNSNLKKDIVITATSIFGGIDIILPDDVNLKLNTTCILGGIDDKSKKNKDAKVTIYLNATCVFGGIDIK